MKKLFCLLCALCAVLFVAIVGQAYYNKAHGNIYEKRGNVVDIDFGNDIVIALDEDGNLWEFYREPGWQIGDPVNLVLNDNNTANITDDIIENVEFLGWIF